MDNKSIFAGTIILLVVVILTQSKTFNHLIDSLVGRVVMLSLVLLASYFHQLLGVIVLFFIIVMINKTDVLEGLTNLTPEPISDNIKKYGGQSESVDLRSRESCIQKGKDSKCIPVNKKECTNCSDISPNEQVEKFSAF
jgi:hypothetical protein